MQQAILVTAYKNIAHLKEIIDFFDDDFLFYIHIDKKTKLGKADTLLLSENKKVVFLSRKFSINWGGFNHLQSILLLASEAIKNKETKYFHLISGHDFPVKGGEYIKFFISGNYGRQFMEHFELPTENWPHGGMDRIEKYNLYDLFNARSRMGKRMIYALLDVQWQFRIKRKLPGQFSRLYGGSTWWTLSADCLNHVFNFLNQNPDFVNRFKYTFCSEEIFFQTIILNSPFRENVVNNNLRHIVWQERNGNYPANLDESDYEDLSASDCLFARKFEYPVSQKLFLKIKEKVTDIRGE